MEYEAKAKFSGKYLAGYPALKWILYHIHEYHCQGLYQFTSIHLA